RRGGAPREVRLGRLGRRLGERARQRERPRRRRRAAAALLLRRLGWGLRLVVGEYLLRWLAGEQALELVLVDRLALDQEPGEHVQLLHVLVEHLAGQRVALLDDAADLVVDLARDLLGVVGL